MHLNTGELRLAFLFMQLIIGEAHLSPFLVFRSHSTACVTSIFNSVSAAARTVVAAVASRARATRKRILKFVEGLGER